MKQINVLFDATVFTGNLIKAGTRAGIYFVAYNILKQFSFDPRFFVLLYFQNSIKFIDDKFLLNFPRIVNILDIKKLNYNVHKENLIKSKNIIKLFIISLKLFKNIILIAYYNITKKYSLKNIDIYFSPMLTCTEEIKINPNIKKYYILYDIAPKLFPQYFPDIDSKYHWVNKLTASLNKESFYFCISQSTKNDFLKYHGNQLDENKLIVTHISTSQTFLPNYDKSNFELIKTKYNIKLKDTDNYILSLCTLEPRKNLIFTLKCFIKFIKKHSISNLYFLLSGAYWNNYIKQLEEQIHDFGEYNKKIIKLGYIDDKDVNSLYSNSLFTVYLSQYEGFGMPPLEAMQAGTPVVCSNNSSLPEVVGDAAITIRYDDEEACIKAFEALYCNENLRKEYVKKGIERAKLFSWEKTYEKMNKVILENFENG